MTALSQHVFLFEAVTTSGGTNQKGGLLARSKRLCTFRVLTAEYGTCSARSHHAFSGASRGTLFAGRKPYSQRTVRCWSSMAAAGDQSASSPQQRGRRSSHLPRPQQSTCAPGCRGLRWRPRCGARRGVAARQLRNCRVTSLRSYCTPSFAISSAMFALIALAAAMSASPPDESPIMRLAIPRPKSE